MKRPTITLLVLLVLAPLNINAHWFGLFHEEPVRLLCHTGISTYEFEIDTYDSLMIVKQRYESGTFSSGTFELEVGEDYYSSKHEDNGPPEYTIDRRTLVLTRASLAQFECELHEVKI